MDDETEKELTSPADFERFLEEEISLAVEFDLPLTLIVIRRGGGWDEESLRTALNVLRLAEFAARLSSDHLASFLPNTGPEGARAVEHRVKNVLPEVSFGFATHLPGDDASELLERAREDSDESGWTPG